MKALCTNRGLLGHIYLTENTSRQHDWARESPEQRISTSRIRRNDHI